jgi:hypothetical protein
MDIFGERPFAVAGVPVSVDPRSCNGLPQPSSVGRKVGGGAPCSYSSTSNRAFPSSNNFSALLPLPPCPPEPLGPPPPPFFLPCALSERQHSSPPHGIRFAVRASRHRRVRVRAYLLRTGLLLALAARCTSLRHPPPALWANSPAS